MNTSDRQPMKLRSLTLTALAIFAGAVAASPARAAGAQPQRGKSVVVSRVSGRVSVRQPSAPRFVAVHGPRSLRVGGFVDASLGVAGVKIATRTRDWSAQLSHGNAQVHQTSSGLTTFQLTGELDCGKAATVARRRPRHTSRSLWVTDQGGPLQSRGNYISAAARGTSWITTDYCGRTVVRVRQGKVLVTNLITHRKVTVTAGHSYTAAKASSPARPAPHFTWSAPAPVGNGGQLAAISCPSVSFCATVNANGDVITSTDPAGGAGTWTTTPITSDIGLNDISCPTSSFCAATDGLSGDVYVSSDPTGGAGAWAPASVVNPDGDGFAGIACPSGGLCVAVDTTGNVLTSTDPSGGASTWSSASINPGNAFSAISCAARALCVAVGTGLSASTDPTGGSGAWRTTTALSLSTDSCPSTRLCVATDQNGNAYVSTDPTGGPSAYKEIENVDTIHPFEPFTGISCQPSGECVAVGLSGDAVVTSDPAGGASAWKTQAIDSSTGINDVSCPTGSLCFAADQSGDVVVGKTS